MSAKQVCIALIRAARLLSLVLALASLIASRGEEFFYTTNNGTATITGCIDFGGGAMVIPSTIDGVLVTGIGPDAFAFGNMSSVTIPDGVTNIGSMAFSQCISLANAVVGNGVISIGNAAFFSCQALTNVVIGTNVATIGSEAFSYCGGLAQVTIPSSVINVGQRAFSECINLVSLVLSNGVTSIGQGAFDSCWQLTGVAIPSTVTNIGPAAFKNCSNLTEMEVPNSITTINEYAFYYCSGLTHISIPNTVTTIGAYAFSLCVNLTNIEIPASVTSLGYAAFYTCPTLKGVYFLGNAPILGQYTFDGDNNATAYFLPGRIGWESTYGGRPTTLWQPKILTGDGSFGVRTNQFGFNINWASGMVVAVDACTTLTNLVWSSLRTNTLTGETTYFSDPEWMNYPARFYPCPLAVKGEERLPRGLRADFKTNTHIHPRHCIFDFPQRLRAGFHGSELRELLLHVCQRASGLLGFEFTA